MLIWLFFSEMSPLLTLYGVLFTLVEDQEEVDMFMAYFEKTWIGKVSVSTCLSFISLHFYIKGTTSKDYSANLYATAISYFC